MNPLYNPRITIPLIKSYIFDSGRIERLDPKQLERYKGKALRKMIKYAYNVPLYHKKFKEAGIHPNDIKSIEDINKLPFISRQDFRENFPDGIVPANFDKEKGHIICTGGTTGKYCCNSGAEPVCIYTDTFTLLQSLVISIRSHRFFNLHWRKTRFAHIGNFNPYKFDEIFDRVIVGQTKSIFSFKNYLSMQASDRTWEILKKLDAFKPDVIISYPAIFQDLAFLKNKGYGKNIKPKLLFVGGAMLDNYTRRYVEDAFGCSMFNTYASCEAGAEIAFECTERNWHIHSDFFHIEVVDENMEPVAPGERGRLVLTRLFGRGTPIIRYTGMEDWVTLGDGEKCSCGLRSPIFGRPVEGRISSNIILPNGAVIPPSEFLFISEVLFDLHTYKVKKFQIVQKKVDEIDILLVIDEYLKDEPPSFEEIAKKIEEVYNKKIGADIKITVKEVKEIKVDPKTGKPDPIVISYVNPNDVCAVNISNLKTRG
jgi:phenylacetate-CoA ligase